MAYKDLSQGMTLRAKIEPEVHVANIVKASGTSFYWAMRRLPPPKRSGMYAIYAFCREVDDIADDIIGAGAEERKRQKLGEWREEIQHVFAGRAQTIVGLALLPAIKNFSLRQEDFSSVIAGMEMDAGNSVRIENMDELTLYCDRVASAVGRLSTRVFGLEPQIGDRLAFNQGQALQLTNILRDIDEDAERERLYLPLELLSSHGIKETADLAVVMKNPEVRHVCEYLACVAERHFQQALSIINSCERDSVRPAAMMLQVYHRVFKKLVRSGWKPPRPRVSLGTLAKLRVMFRYGVF